jgi:hypothetical protein
LKLNFRLLALCSLGGATLAHGGDFFAVGAGPGAGPQLNVYQGLTGTAVSSFFAFAPAFAGGVRVAVGDVNGDGIQDAIAGAGPGGGPHVRSFSIPSGAVGHDFFSSSPSENGGIYTATKRNIGVGTDEMLVGSGEGDLGMVRRFSGSALLSSFLPYGSGFSGGVRVASGDVNGDGLGDIITGAGAGGGPIKVFETSGSLIASFTPFAGFTGGVYVASGDVDGDGRADIITSLDEGSVPHVKVFSGANLSEIRSFFAYAPSFTGGVRVASGDINGDGRADIITGAGPGGSPEVKIFNGLDNSVIGDFFAFNPSFAGGVYVGSGANPVPEPATFVFLAVGCAAIFIKRRR